MPEEAALFSLGAFVGVVDELDGGGEVISDAELLEHALVGDALAEGGDDVRVRCAGDLVARLAEALEVLTKCFVVALAHRAVVVEGEVELIGALEVGNEL